MPDLFGVKSLLSAWEKKDLALSNIILKSRNPDESGGGIRSMLGFINSPNYNSSKTPKKSSESSFRTIYSFSEIRHDILFPEFTLMYG